MLDIDQPMPRVDIASGTAVMVQNLRTLTFNDGACCELSPVTGNIHGVSCVGDRSALMLDVNIPPYIDDICHYFAPTTSSSQLCVIDEALAWSSCRESAASLSTTQPRARGGSASGSSSSSGSKHSRRRR
jgi:hypothetical protein